MPLIDQYTVKDAKLRLLLQGPSGSGKTTLACHFPRPWIFDLDRNLAGPLAWLRRNNRPLPVGYDVMDTDDNGKEVPMPFRWDRLDQKLREVQARDDVDTIVIDTATRLSDIVMEYTKRMQPNTKDGRQIFGFFYQYGKAFLDVLTRMNKHIVFICHEKPVMTESGGLVKYEVHWPGQLADIMPAFFTDNWRCEVQAIPSGLELKHKWVLRTLPAPYLELKNSLNLPQVFEFDWNRIETALKETVGLVNAPR